MLDSKQREAQLLQARERLARAFARLEIIIGNVPGHIRSLESSRDQSKSRIKEVEELLARERAITAQRQSLSEGATEEAHSLSGKLGKAEKNIIERDKKIIELEKDLNHRSGELLAYGKTHADALERERKLLATISRLEEENNGFERQLELLKQEGENIHQQLSEAEEKESSYALMFTQDERLSLLKTVDTLIERVDNMTHIELIK